MVRMQSWGVRKRPGYHGGHPCPDALFEAWRHPRVLGTPEVLDEPPPTIPAAKPQARQLALFPPGDLVHRAAPRRRALWELLFGGHTSELPDPVGEHGVRGAQRREHNRWILGEDRVARGRLELVRVLGRVPLLTAEPAALSGQGEERLLQPRPRVEPPRGPRLAERLEASREVNGWWPGSVGKQPERRHPPQGLVSEDLGHVRRETLEVLQAPSKLRIFLCPGEELEEGIDPGFDQHAQVHLRQHPDDPPGVGQTQEGQEPPARLLEQREEVLTQRVLVERLVRVQGPAVEGEQTGEHRVVADEVDRPGGDREETEDLPGVDPRHLAHGEPDTARDLQEQRSHVHAPPVQLVAVEVGLVGPREDGAVGAER